MNKSTLQIIYTTFVLVMMSLFISSSSVLEVGKLFLLVVLSYMLFEITTNKRESTVYHHFNILFAISMIVFVVYALMYRGELYTFVRVQFLLASLIGLSISLIYTPRKRKVVLPPRPLQAKSAKRTVRRVKKVTRKAAPKKVAKKATKKAVKKSTKKVTKKKVAKRVVRRVKKVTRKVAPKKVAKKSSSRSTSMDRNLISFDQDHEVAYLLRKFKKRITKENKAKLIAFGKKFKATKSFKPHNRESFYNYMKKYKVLSKLN